MRKCGGVGDLSLVGDCFNILGVLGNILLVCFVLCGFFYHCFGGNLCFMVFFGGGEKFMFFVDFYVLWWIFLSLFWGKFWKLFNCHCEK